MQTNTDNLIKNLLYIILSLLACGNSFGQSASINWSKSNPWVDSVLSKLSNDEKIAQLMMVAAWSNKDKSHVQDLECQIKEIGVGGLIFFKGTPFKQAKLTNQYQKISKVPLLIGIDGEWGLSMRLDSVPVFPRQMILGAANDLELTRQYGNEIGKQCKRMGIHLNFAPDVDVNNNMANPVINDRSFGENKFTVAKHGIAYAKGMQEQQVMACAKHFPGHGDTENDSHFGLPVIKGNRKRLDSLELYPFKELIKHDVASVMSAHLCVPALDSTPNVASSISPLIINGLLKKEMGFEGIVITDGLNMKAVSNFYSPGEVAAKAFAAGNDMLLFVEDVPQSIQMIKEYIKRGEITWEQVNQSCRKILTAKYWCGLGNYKPINNEHLSEDLNCCETELFIKKVVKNGVTVVKNADNIIPLIDADKYKIASVAVGNPMLSDFQQMVNNYTKCDFYAIDKNDSKFNFDSLFDKLQYYNLVIVSLHNTSRFVSKKLGLTQQQIDFINRLNTSRKCILVNNGNPYILQHFTNFRNIIVSYEDLPIYNQVAAQLLFGAYASKGSLPVSVTTTFPLGSGIETEKANVFEYVYPEEVSIPRNNFTAIDSIITDAIKQKAMPGCQVLVAKDGKVLYNKSFGFQTYDSLKPVRNYHLYDIASLTKIMSTTLAMMKLYETGKISLDDKIGLYLPWLNGSDKEKLKIKDIMLHQAGLTPFIPFYKKTLIAGQLNPNIYSKIKDSIYTVQVADSLYIHKDYEKEIWSTIASSESKTQGNYVYSDLGFMMLRKVVEVISNQDFETYLKENIYTPLKLSSMVFNPTKIFNRAWIVPTELDTTFRKQLLQGYVHDPAAAMLGGVSGHAGLFSNANDVAIIMQMLLNGGTYGGRQIFKSSTVDLFTKKQMKKGNRRGLGFDKPETEAEKASPTSSSCSPQTFGHTGFTGTCTWADPKNNLVFVFLSNRVNPSAENKKLTDLNVRTRLQDAIYEAVKKK